MNNELHLFTGVGGGILGGEILGHTCVCAVEIEEYRRKILLQRQRDGILPVFPIWDDVTTFDGRPWRGRVDIVCGGFPCQDISVAGKGEGIEGARSGLWGEMSRIVGEIRPEYVFVENSPALAIRGLGRVLGDLFENGYDAEWACLSAEEVILHFGDPAFYHERNRIWILAKASDSPRVFEGWPEQRTERQRTREGGQSVAESSISTGSGAGLNERGVRNRPSRANGAEEPEGQAKEAADAESARLEGYRTDSREPQISESRNDSSPEASDSTGVYAQGQRDRSREREFRGSYGRWWQSEPAVGRVAHGLAYRVDRLSAIGDGQVPIVAATAFRMLERRFLDSSETDKDKGIKLK